MNRNTQCACCNVRGEIPFTAFTMNALIISISTAIGTVVKEEYDKDGDRTVAAFFLYLTIVFFTVIAIHSFSMFSCAFGGGMLSNPSYKLIPSVNYYLYGTQYNPFDNNDPLL